MWDLSSLTRDQICTPALEGEVLTVWPLGTSLWTYFNKYHHYCWGPGTLHSVRNAFLSLFGLVDSAINQWDFFFFFECQNCLFLLDMIFVMTTMAPAFAGLRGCLSVNFETVYFPQNILFSAWGWRWNLLINSQISDGYDVNYGSRIGHRSPRYIVDLITCWLDTFKLSHLSGILVTYKCH